MPNNFRISVYLPNVPQDVPGRNERRSGSAEKRSHSLGQEKTGGEDEISFCRIHHNLDSSVLLPVQYIQAREGGSERSGIAY
jgi:hypothetical protein